MAKRSATRTPTQTQEQAENLVKYVSAFREKEGGGSLKLAYSRGLTAQHIIEDPDTFGRPTRKVLAETYFGVKKLTLDHSIRFSELVSREQLDALCKIQPPPTWEGMSGWLHIKDDKARNDMLADILAGNITRDGLTAAVQKAAGRGPSKPRKPTAPQQAIKRITGAVVTCSAHVTEWIPSIHSQIQKLKDESSKRLLQNELDELLSKLAELANEIAKTKSALKTTSASTSAKKGKKKTKT